MAPNISSTTVSELLKAHRTPISQKESATIRSIHSHLVLQDGTTAGRRRGWMVGLGDTLMISAIVRADPAGDSEFANTSRVQTRTRRLYDLPRAAPALAPLLLRPPSSACSQPVSVGALVTSIFQPYVPLQCFLLYAVSNRASHLPRLLACPSRSQSCDYTVGRLLHYLQDS